VSEEEITPQPGEPPRDAARADVPEITGTPPVRTRIEVPGRVFVRAVVAALITFALFRFFTQVLGVGVLLALALILTAILVPLVDWLERHGLGRGFASALGVLLVVVIVLAVLGVVVPPLVVQGIELANTLPALIDRWRTTLERYPDVLLSLEGVAHRLRENPGTVFTSIIRFSVGAATTIFGGILLLTLTLYFLIDRERVRAGVLRQVPAAYRERADRTISGVALVCRAYFAGQLVLSTSFAIVTFVLLTVLGVPFAAILAALAFFLDGIPNIGSLIAIILPALMGLTRSLTTAIIVAAVLIVYNQIENYLISPKILSGRLRVPPVLTMIAILVGGELFGILGIIIAIPLAGAVPVIERIWLTGDGSNH
jgi:predicted PurR-regulated permease PerM